ncbi:FAD-dependent oxidoreductase [Dictyobacter kobayashii]|uniref:FAD/NAD(P)-binding domain-containing protein n=1 Tax=Dictyobacter kobayashii TaxID=2014872 RepID=A0A402AS58_9CHLR|nr:FAD-dependent oxidoreductase [Dictyobacter kobayashii]GCE21883.1 hypothetical protein KDK_56830 [Dictyobacter kobayashii]
MSVIIGGPGEAVEVSNTTYDVVVLGAGPYGLSAAAHLKQRGLKVAVFGKPLLLWREHMPQGMLLRSYWWASNLSDPAQKYTFKHYLIEQGIEPSPSLDPLPIQTFIDYALWFQQHAVPDLDETYISSIERNDRHYTVKLVDGRILSSRTIVMAPGLHYYRYIPEEYRALPSNLVSHSTDHQHFRDFAGKEVAIIGRGQAALETAALAAEAGANVQIISRSPLKWVKVASGKLPPWLQQLRAPKAGMGSSWMNLLLEKYPYMLQRLPQERRDTLVDTTHGPAGSHWLKPRLLGKVQILEETAILEAKESGERVTLKLSTGKSIEVDHVILGTGFKADLKRLPMLDPTITEAVRTYQGSPVLNTWFQSSMPGLYFIGYSSVRSFSPMYRFVIGADAAAKRVSSAIARDLTVAARV